MFHRSLVLAAIAYVGLLSGCGGGGGGPAPQPVATLSVGPPTIAVSAVVTGTAPSASLIASIQADTSTPGSYTYYGKGTSTHIGIASITQVNGGAGSYTIVFATPATLGVGTYQDTITVEACYDSACTQQIMGSPQTVAVTYTVLPAPPVLSSLSPDVAQQDTAFTLTINGSGFTSASVVEFAGQAVPTTFLSASQLQASISANAIMDGGTYNVAVASSDFEGAPLSNTLVESSVGVGAISGISPSTAVAGASQFTLTVTGSFFPQTAVVVWGGTVLPTTVVNPQQLTASVSASLVQNVASVPITVRSTPDPVAPVSNAVSFTVQPLPTLAFNSVYPGTVTVGAAGLQLTLLGQGFLPTAVALWNGTPLATTYVSQSQLQAQLPAADVASAGTAAVAVENTSGAATSTPTLPVLIAAPASDATALQINAAHTGAVAFNGLSFPTASTWAVDTGGTPSYALIAEGKVVVASQTAGGNSQLVALDQATGATVWGPIPLSGLGNATYEAGKVFVLSAPIVSSTTATLQSFDIKSGHLDWSSTIAGPPGGGVYPSAPTALNGQIYGYGFGPGTSTGMNQFSENLYAFTESTGATAWTATMPSGQTGAPAVTNSGVYATLNCFAGGFQAANGAVLFADDASCLGSSEVGTIPAVANNVLYAPDGNLGTYTGQTLNATTGAALGTFTALYPPAVGTQNAFLTLGGSLSAVSVGSNAVAWTFAGDGALNTSPLLVNQAVIVGSEGGNLYALDAMTGTQLWTINVGSRILASPDGSQLNTPLSGMAAGDGVLIVPLGTGIVCFTLSTNP